MRTLVLGALLTLLAGPATVSAQVLRGVGVFAGSVESRQLRPREPDSDPRTGLLAGGWLDLQLPGSTWSVLAEAAWVERGGTYPDVTPSPGEVVVDHVVFTLAPEFHLDVAFVGAFAYGGPSLELPVRTRASDALEPAFREPATQVVSVTGGAGIEWRLPETFAFRLELRHVEGLSPAFTGDAGDFTHRSTEIVVRIGRTGASIP